MNPKGLPQGKRPNVNKEHFYYYDVYDYDQSSTNNNEREKTVQANIIIRIRRRTPSLGVVFGCNVALFAP